MADRTDIDIARVGTFDLQQGGRVTFTREMLVDAARRATEAGSAFRAPVKLGHTDPRNDGEPAFGWLHNLRTEGDGDATVLKADVAGMPQWLADTAPSAYPDRSIEGNVIPTAASDGSAGLQITALALLGVTPPGIGTLQSWRDLPKALAAAADLPLTAFAAAFHALRTPEPPAAEPAEYPIPKGADAMSDSLNKGLRERLGVKPDAQLDEAGLLAALDEALTEKADPSAESIAAALKVTPEQVRALTPEKIAAATVTSEKPVETPKLPDGTVTINKDALDELRIAAAAGAEARARQLREDRDVAIADAVRGGKIAASRREHWAKSWDADPEGTAKILSDLDAIYPIEAAGYAGHAEMDSASEDALYRQFFPAATEKAEV